jgi:hypothetical protein
MRPFIAKPLFVKPLFVKPFIVKPLIDRPFIVKPFHREAVHREAVLGGERAVVRLAVIGELLNTQSRRGLWLTTGTGSRCGAFPSYVQ